jgi:AcrR family transcriptional regulator
MSNRLSRIEQTERNRSLLLAAARRVFMARGYHGATLEQIADEAGFSKGVVYSQFRSKADLFLALLEERIERRAAENAELAAGLAGERGVAVIFEHSSQVARTEPEWGLLVIEFRVHAARDPDVNRRYASAHARTIENLAEVFATVYGRGDEEPPFPPRQMAEMLLAIGAGAQLEQAADPDALQGPLVAELLTRVFTSPATTSSGRKRRPRRVA